MAFRSKSKHTGGFKDPSSLSQSIFHMAPVSSASSNGLFSYSATAGSQNSPSPPAGPGYASSKRRLPLRKVENGPITGWLEAMKDSSPPRMRCLQTDAFDKSEVDADDMEYRAWMMRSVVKEIAAVFPTAIITGRSRDKVYEFVQLPELYYAGSHGMDIMGPAEGCGGCKAQGTRTVNEEGNEVVLFQPASEFTVVMDEIFKLLEEKANKVTGAKVEHNKFCVSIHFRRVKEEDWLPLAEQVQHVLKSYPNLCLTQGRKVLEVRPSIMWNKGKALDYLLKTLGFGNRSDIFPIYIGDDLTDEDAFKTVVRRKHGLAILVSNVAKETNATYSLRDPGEVLEFLRSLVKWKRRRPNRHLIAASQKASLTRVEASP